nr:hypothetical protein [Tanacetum cinerariifolium]
MSSKAFRVCNKRTRRVEENLHVEFLENKAIEKGAGPNWLFDIDSLTKSMNYVPVDADGVEADVSNMETTIIAIPTFTLKIHKDHPKSQIIGPMDTPIQTRIKSKEEGIDYDEVFAPVARIEAIRLFLAYASFMGFIVYQMNVNSAFLYGTIDEEVYVMQPPGFQDPKFPAKVYKVEKAMYGLHQAPRAWYVLQKEDGIFLSQDKYVGDILKKFGYSDVRSSNTPIDKENPWGKDGTVKRIFRYLKGHPKLGLWYHKESPFDLVAYFDSDYGGATQDRKSTTGGCQFLGRRLISWQCKKQIVVATSTTEAKYVAAANLLTKPFDAGRFPYLVSEHNVDFHPIVDFVEASPLRRARIAQSSALPPVADEPASPLRDVSQAPWVTSPAATEGSMQQTLNELSALCTSLQWQHSEMVSKFKAQVLEINMLKARVKLLEDREGGGAKRSRDDATIKGRNLDKGEAATERWIYSHCWPPAAEVPTDSDVFPPTGPIFSTAIVVTPYTKRKGKETMVESETIKKKKVQEQIDAQVVRELEEQMAREDQRMSEQIARDAEIVRIHAEEELQIMIDGLDMSNETVAKYQDNYAKVHKFQTQQRKPWSKKQKRDYYMTVIKSNLVWKVKDFRGMTFEEIEAKFTTESVKKLKTSEEVPEDVKTLDEVLEEKVKEMMQLVPIEEVYVEALQVKHPIIDWKVHTEGQRSYWKITRLGGSSASYQFFVDMLKHLDREDLNQLWALMKESLSIRPPTNDKEMELWVELKKLYEPDNEDQLWTHTQNLMHALVEWKLYDTCGVHHVTSKDKEIFILVEKDYPLRKGLAIGMISYKLQVENYSKMANDLILKIYKIANSPRQQDDLRHPL